ncbi:uncharacterized protein, partial [Sinocyclocheilus grahami]|uniref:uncharacterized protein n=1 Tax=Sinocyclocheilus grahami TaxID=75366 RepID=UPI0007AD2186
EKVDSEVVKALDSDIEMTEPPKSPETHEEQNESEVILNSELNMNEDLSRTKDVGLEEDGGHFNRNKDAQIGFEDTEEIQKGPHAILENPVDIGFHFEVDPSSGSLESPRVSDFHDTEASSDSSSSSTSDELWGFVLLVKEYLGVRSPGVTNQRPPLASHDQSGRTALRERDLAQRYSLNIYSQSVSERLYIRKHRLPDMSQRSAIYTVFIGFNRRL